MCWLECYLSVRVFCVLVRVLFVSKSVLCVGEGVFCVLVRVLFVCKSVLCVGKSVICQ